MDFIGSKSIILGWWITSALESNIGLNAIAQWTFFKHNLMPQGLGTGAFIPIILTVLLTFQGQLWYKKSK
jgi:hypothetical protein